MSSKVQTLGEFHDSAILFVSWVGFGVFWAVVIYILFFEKPH